ncbi:DgyrCDS5562 [Dimorphilus gyrociliatus]|uniref:DgyrCDS5562 n=1 Tax=Dimorphilus gyrociliatus TaxID=2664684 RepID=A0A7I8VLX1_9ANNE|nr:DgyrCDS5562 [Dimorphilus gyrociliatus]
MQFLVTKSDKRLEQETGVLDMTHFQARLETYTNWVLTFVDKVKLAEAGLFYTGVGDRVQCAFCHGVLRSWREGDEPMLEHKRHYPNCGFIIGSLKDSVKKGNNMERRKIDKKKYESRNDRVRSFHQISTKVNIVKLSTNGFFFNGLTNEIECHSCGSSFSLELDIDNLHSLHDSSCSYAIEPKETRQPPKDTTDGCVKQGVLQSGQIKTSIESDVRMYMGSDIVQNVLKMGYTREMIETFIWKKGTIFTDANSLINNFLDTMQEETLMTESSILDGLSKENGQSSPTTSKAKRKRKKKKPKKSDEDLTEKPTAKDEIKEQSDNNSDSISKDIEQLKERKERLEEERKCAICFDRDRNTIFTPCFHFTTCFQCAKRLNLCPMCNKPIKSRCRVAL